MAKPKLALIPASQGTKLYSVLPANGVGDFAFTRAGSATRINSQGLIETVASGVSRLNYPLIDGVVNGCPSHLLELQRTNLIPYSEDFSQWVAGNSTVNPNQAISPDGTLNADLVTANGTNAQHYVIQSQSSSAKTMSVFAKAGTHQFIQILTSGAAAPVSNYDLINGTTNLIGSSSTSSIENYGNGWYRCILSTTDIAAGDFYICFSNSLSSGRFPSFLSSGTIYLWGGQSEANSSYPTSYIPNYGTALGVTRSAETANGAGDASTFNSAEGVLFAEISALADDGTYRFISLKNNTTEDIIRIGYITTSNCIEIQNYKAGVLLNYFNYEVEDVKTNSKIAFKWKDNDFQLYINGLNVLSNTSVTAWGSGVFQSLQFDQHNGASPFYGNTKQIQYYDSALTDSELETLTSWVSFQDMANGQLYTIE